MMKNAKESEVHIVTEAKKIINQKKKQKCRSLFCFKELVFNCP